ncbi:AraC family transcriptional regulator [Paenibacillus sp. CAU 1782]
MNQATTLFESHYFLRNHPLLDIVRYPEDFEVPFHSHEFIEYCYVAEGKGFHYIQNETFPVHKGMLFAIPVGASHVFRPSSPGGSEQPLIVYNCLFGKDMVEQLSRLLEEDIVVHLTKLANQNQSYFSVFDSDGAIERLLMAMYREKLVPGPGFASLMQAYLSQLVIAVYRLNNKDSAGAEPNVADFSIIIDYIENHLSLPITLSDLSVSSKWSGRHLQRLFQKHFGQPFGAYLRNARIQKSCELLRHTSYKISYIAELVGYRNSGAFNAVFKKVVGKSPAEFRKLNN